MAIAECLQIPNAAEADSLQQHYLKPSEERAVYGLVHFNAYAATAAFRKCPEGSQGFTCQESTQTTRKARKQSSAPGNLEFFALRWHSFNRQAGKCLP